MTDTIGTVDGIIKRDTHGRMKTNPERRRARLEEFDRSAMTGRKFAAWAGIKYTTFASWRSRGWTPWWDPRKVRCSVTSNGFQKGKCGLGRSGKTPSVYDATMASFPTTFDLIPDELTVRDPSEPLPCGEIGREKTQAIHDVGF